MSINNSSSTKSHILRSATVIGLATFLSRISGFVRDMVLAFFFGTGLEIQAFIVAFRLPNLLRDLVGEGITNTTLVPVFSKLLTQEKKKEFLNLAQFLCRMILIILVAIVLVSQFIAPLLVRLIAPGFCDNLAKLNLTVKLTRITFIYILLIGLVAFNTSILNSLRNFAPSAIGPVLLNLSLIIGAFVSVRVLPAPIVGLAWAVVIGGLLQLIIQLPALRAKGISLKFKLFDFSLDSQTKELSKRIGRLFWPRVVGSAVYQLNVFIDTIMASLSFLVGQGAVAAIYYANRIIQFPLGVFAFALSNALLPQLSSLVQKGDREEIKSTFYFALRVIAAIMVPASLFIILHCGPIIRAVFQRGQFSAYSTQITAWALLFYALGLFFFAAVRIVLVCFYAFEDTRRPVQIAFICLILNLILNILLAIPLKVGGLALASSLSSLLNLTLLCHSLKKRHIPTLEYSKIFGASLLKVFFCALVMAAFSRLISQTLLSGWPVFISVGLNLILSFLIYLALGSILKVGAITDTLQWILKRN